MLQTSHFTSHIMICTNTEIVTNDRYKCNLDFDSIPGDFVMTDLILYVPTLINKKGKPITSNLTLQIHAAGTNGKI